MISVLMSIYNEKIEFVKKAVDSILNQSYKELELIIVLDNPGYAEMQEMLNTYEAADARVKIRVNQQNIGLARSLNYAMDNAHGEYLARMDADDISNPTRLEEELNYLITQNLDIVGCAVNKIDKNDTVWGEIRLFSDDLQLIKELLPIQNVIVHPTVLMRTDVIRSVGGYRNFASCQDYDLWLRLLTSGYRIGILNRKLFQFRRHENSITATKRFNQVLNEMYIRQLYAERCRLDQDSFSEENLNAFLKANGFFNPNISDKENQKLIQYSFGIQALKRHQIILGTWYVFKVLDSKVVRENIRTSIEAIKIKKRYRNGSI